MGMSLDLVWRATSRPHFSVGLGLPSVHYPAGLPTSVPTACLGRGPLGEAFAVSLCHHRPHAPPVPGVLPDKCLARSPL